MGRPGWNEAYAATLQINGRPGELEIIGCPLSTTEALRQLEAAYRDLGARVFVGRGETMGWGLAARAGRVTRFLVTPCDRTGECVVYRLTQDLDDFQRSLRPPDRHLLNAVPSLTGSRPLLTVSNEKASSTVEISAADHGWEAGPAVDHLAAALESQGWIAPVPAAPEGPAPLARMYLKGHDLALIQATTGPDGVRIIRVYKQLKR